MGHQTHQNNRRASAPRTRFQTPHSFRPGKTCWDCHGETTRRFTLFHTTQWIGLRENLQESPTFNGKIYGFL
jgi:hypothetical protein